MCRGANPKSLTASLLAVRRPLMVRSILRLKQKVKMRIQCRSKVQMKSWRCQPTNRANPMCYATQTNPRASVPSTPPLPLSTRVHPAHRPAYAAASTPTLQRCPPTAQAVASKLPATSPRLSPRNPRNSIGLSMRQRELWIENGPLFPAPPSSPHLPPQPRHTRAPVQRRHPSRR